MIRDAFFGWAGAIDAALAAGAARTRMAPTAGSRWLIAWVAACLLVGLTLFAACGYEAGFLRLNHAASALPDWVWQWLTSFGDERMAFAIGLLVSIHRPRVFWALVLAAVVATAYSRGLKPLFDMPRPPAVLEPESFNLIGPGHRRGSFPSGHSVTAGVLFGVLVQYARWSQTRVLLILLALLAGLSRVALGVHWPVDVAAGLMGGVLAAWIGGRLAARWDALASDASVHLAFVTLACFFAVTLTYFDGGYPLARPLLQSVGWVALGHTLLFYVFFPLRAVRRGRPL